MSNYIENVNPKNCLSEFKKLIHVHLFFSNYVIIWNVRITRIQANSEELN